MAAAVRPEDVAFNRVSVALARSQSLVASWLPAPSAPDEAAQKTAEQLHKEESALFTPGSDILGVGAEPPKEILDGSFKRSKLSSNERLRQQILGKNATRGRGAQPADSKSAAAAAAAHLPTKKLERSTKPTKPRDDSSDEGEDGRAAMFKSKKRVIPVPVKEDLPKEKDSDTDDEEKGRARVEKQRAAAPQAQEKTRKRPVSYLDELLEERSRKKNKKQKAKVEAPAAKEAVQSTEVDSREAQSASTGKHNLPALDGERPGAEQEEAGNAATQPAPTKVTVQDQKAGDPATAAENALLDRSDKKKKRKNKKKNKKKDKGEAVQPS